MHSTEKNRNGEETVKNKQKSIQCDICNVKLKSQRQLVFHKRRHEKDSSDKAVYDQFITENFDMTCDHCDVKFITFQNARQHYKDKHNENDGYLKCCGKKLRQLWMVQDHINTHLNPETFK